MMSRIDDALLDRLAAAAAASPRLRAHHNLHASIEEPYHRLAIASEPGTYIRPHRHANPAKWELMAILRGSAVLLTFAEDGEVLERTVIAEGGACRAAEIPAGAWHGFATLTPRTAILEVKTGPYVRPPPCDFASWAPEEGEPAAADFARWLAKAETGARPPPL